MYHWLPCPAVPKDKEGSIEDHIGWVLTQPSLKPQVVVRTQGIIHFRAFTDICQNCAKLEWSIHAL